MPDSHTTLNPRVWHSLVIGFAAIVAVNLLSQPLSASHLQPAPDEGRFGGVEPLQLAQAGSTGGSVGKTERSISGVEPKQEKSVSGAERRHRAERHRPKEKRITHSKPERAIAVSSSHISCSQNRNACVANTMSRGGIPTGCYRAYSICLRTGVWDTTAYGPFGRRMTGMIRR
jgi:hypothetical protein